MEAIGRESRDHVEMNMGNDLSGSLAIGLGDADAVRLKSFHLCPGNSLDRDDQFLKDLRGCLHHGVVVRFRNDERVPLNDGANVHERKDIVVLKDFSTGDFTLDDFTKYAVLSHSDPLQPCVISS